MNIDSNNLSGILKQFRKERKLSLRQFSEQLNISHAYLNKLEKGEDSRTGKPITPTIETLVKIAEGLEIPTRKFLNMCGYFSLNLSANEKFDEGDLNIDNEISMIIAQMTPETTVIVGETVIDETAKASLREELRQALIKIRNVYDIEV